MSNVNENGIGGTGGFFSFSNMPGGYVFHMGSPANSLNNVAAMPPGLIDSFRNMFTASGIAADPKASQRKNLVEVLIPVGPSDVADFPTECSICLGPLFNFETMDKTEQIEYLTKRERINQDYIINGAAPNDPSIPIAGSEFDNIAKHYKLKDDSVFANEEHEAVQIPSCKHIFGRSCITTWLKTSSSCPLCRAEISKATKEENKNMQNDMFEYPMALSEYLLPSSYIDFDPNVAMTPDPDISMPSSSHSMNRVLGPRIGPLLSNIQARYAGNSNSSNGQQQQSAPSAAPSAGLQNNALHDEGVGTEAPVNDSSRGRAVTPEGSGQSGGPMRGGSRAAGSRLNPYSRS